MKSKSFVLLVFSLLFLDCAPITWEPPLHPEPENPPCITQTTPGALSMISLQPVFTVELSKTIREDTATDEFVFLVEGDVDYLFLRDLESPPVSVSREDKIIPLTVTITARSTSGTTLLITPKVNLKGDSIYTLVVSKGIRDEQSRPLNRCIRTDADAIQDIETYRTGASTRYSYITEPEPPPTGKPKIVEVMVYPNVPNGQYVEIVNADATDSLKLVGFSLDDGSGKPRELTYKSGGSSTIPPNGKAVVVEPDYDLVGNPYKIPSNVAIFTTKGSSTTMVDSGIGGSEELRLVRGGIILESISLGVVNADRTKTSKKSVEKCGDLSAVNQESNWKESSDPLGGTPGRDNSCP